MPAPSSRNNKHYYIVLSVKTFHIHYLVINLTTTLQGSILLQMVRDGVWKGRGCLRPSSDVMPKAVLEPGTRQILSSFLSHYTIIFLSGNLHLLRNKSLRGHWNLLPTCVPLQLPHNRSPSACNLIFFLHVVPSLVASVFSGFSWLICLASNFFPFWTCLVFNFRF